MAKDDLTFTIRVHDPLEKQDATKSTNWAVVDVPRAALLSLTPEEFCAKYVLPELGRFKILFKQEEKAA